MNPNHDRSLKSHIAFTIATRSYLAGALVWRKSLADSNVGIRGLIYLTDAKPHEIALLCAETQSVAHKYADGLEYDLRSVESAEIPDDAGMRERYDIIEYCTAIKPSLFLSLAIEFPGMVLHYFDPDILVLGELSELIHFSKHHNFTLTPHMSTPTDDHFRLSQLDILRAGVFNFGYVGWNPEFESGWPLIRWWQRRLNRDSRVALAEGIFTDQSWGALFCASPESGIFHDASYNVAYWNLHEREISGDEKSVYFCNDRKLQFFHFSGYSPRKRDQLSLHQNRHVISGLRGLLKLCNCYADKLLSAGFEYWGATYSIEKTASEKKLIRSKVNETGRVSKSNFISVARSRADSRIVEAFGNPRSSLIKAGIVWWLEFLTVMISLALSSSSKCSRLSSHQKQLHEKAFSQIKKTSSPNLGLLSEGFLYWCYRVRFALSKSMVPESSNEKTLLVYSESPSDHGGKNILNSSNNLAVVGYITAETGLGESVRGMIRALETAQTSHDLYDLTDHYARKHDLEFAEKVISCNSTEGKYETCILHINADQVPYQIPRYPSSLICKSTRRIAYWYWETEILPQTQVPAANYFDEIWVATKFVQEALIRSGVRVPVRVIPPAMSSLPTTLFDRDYFNLPQGRQICLSVFDATSFLGRKNPLGVVKAMKRLYETIDPPPILVLKTTNMKEYDLKKLIEFSYPLEIIVYNRYFTREETLSLISVADCFISLHRAEGLGLSLIDAMRLGTPLVATDYSGPKDFVTHDNAFLVPWKYCATRWEDGPYFGSLWADPDIEVAAKLIESALGGGKHIESHIRQAKQTVEEYFSRLRVSKLIAEVI